MIGSLLRRLPLAACVLVFGWAAGSAHAQSPGVTLDQYRMAPTADDGFALSRPGDLGHKVVGAQLHLEYANDPLVYERELGESDTERRAIVAHQLVGHVGVTLGLWDRLVVFLGAPVTLWMDGDDEPGVPSADGTRLGDPWVGARVRLYGDAEDFGSVALQGRLYAPVADAIDDDQAYVGERSVLFLPEVVAEVRRRIRVTANLGLRIREEATFGSNLVVDDELTFGLGVGVPILEDRAVPGRARLSGVLEVYGATALDDFGAREQTPIEALIGARYQTRSGLTLGLAGGPGLQRGYGAPDVRLVAMIGMGQPSAPPPPPAEPAPPPPPPEPEDTDGDGLVDARDQCPAEPEDADGFEDADGCPDPDNDADGVPDAEDACPLQPEDVDDFEDADGCPDPDNDGDGVLDADDDCPTEAGPGRNAGCPEPDSDGDGVVDRRDNCPNEPGPPENQGCAEEQRVRIEEDRLEILEKVFFRTNRARIQPRSYPLLDNVAQVLNAHPEITLVRVEGHTDARGARRYNLRLSQARADAVVQYLVRRGDVEESRLEAIGFGPDRPVVEDATTDEQHGQNRRVEFRIVPPEGSEGGDTAADGAEGAGEGPEEAEAAEDEATGEAGAEER